MSEARIRPWLPGDGPGVDGLVSGSVDALSVDALWERQFHALHGPDSDAPQWRRCRVVTDRDGSVLAAATVVVNSLHSGRMPGAIEVSPAWRRRGVGTLLLSQIAALRPDPRRPLSCKLRADDTAAMAFVSHAGGRIYQRCPGIIVDTSHRDVQQWVTAQPKARCTDLTGVQTDALVAAFADLYTWTHRDWSPVSNTEELQAVSRAEICDADPALSTGAWEGDRLAALALAFPRDNGIDVVAEAVHPQQAGGQQLVAGSIAAVLAKFTLRGGGRVHFDGHISDPHLQPVLEHIPQAATQAVNLVEID